VGGPTVVVGRNRYVILGASGTQITVSDMISQESVSHGHLKGLKKVLERRGARPSRVHLDHLGA
jgi:hypothetical protein